MIGNAQALRRLHTYYSRVCFEFGSRHTIEFSREDVRLELRTRRVCVELCLAPILHAFWLTPVKLRLIDAIIDAFFVPLVNMCFQSPFSALSISFNKQVAETEYQDRC